MINQNKSGFFGFFSGLNRMILLHRISFFYALTDMIFDKIYTIAFDLVGFLIAFMFRSIFRSNQQSIYLSCDESRLVDCVNQTPRERQSRFGFVSLCMNCVRGEQ